MAKLSAECWWSVKPVSSMGMAEYYFKKKKKPLNLKSVVKGDHDQKISGLWKQTAH